MTPKGVPGHQLANGVLRREALRITLAILALQALPQWAGEWRPLLPQVACGGLLLLLEGCRSGTRQHARRHDWRRQAAAPDRHVRRTRQDEAVLPRGGRLRSRRCDLCYCCLEESIVIVICADGQITRFMLDKPEWSW